MNDREQRQEIKEILAGCDAYISGKAVVPPIINEYALVEHKFVNDWALRAKKDYFDVFLRKYGRHVNLNADPIQLAPELKNKFDLDKVQKTSDYRAQGAHGIADLVAGYTLFDLAEAAGERVDYLRYLLHSQSLSEGETRNLEVDIRRLVIVREASLEARDLP